MPPSHSAQSSPYYGTDVDERDHLSCTRDICGEHIKRPNLSIQSAKHHKIWYRNKLQQVKRIAATMMATTKHNLEVRVDNTSPAIFLETFGAMSIKDVMTGSLNNLYFASTSVNIVEKGVHAGIDAENFGIISRS